MKARTSGSASSISVASFGTLGHSWSATWRHCAVAAAASSWAKAVAMNAETTRRPLLPACASTLRMKWTRGLLKNPCRVGAVMVGRADVGGCSEMGWARPLESPIDVQVLAAGHNGVNERENRGGEPLE